MGQRFMGLRRSFPICGYFPLVQVSLTRSVPKLTVSAREVRLAGVPYLIRDVVEPVAIGPRQGGANDRDMELVCASVALEELVRLQALESILSLLDKALPKGEMH